jgi:hypothetical protein
MLQNKEAKGQPRRTFLAGFLAGVGGAALLSAPKRARAARQTPTVPATGPILYRRTKETERYYKTLYL